MWDKNERPMREGNLVFVLFRALLLLLLAIAALPSSMARTSPSVSKEFHTVSQTVGGHEDDFVHDTCVFDSCCSTFLLVGRLVINDPLNKAWLQESLNVDGHIVSMPGVEAVTNARVNRNQLEANELLRRLRRVQRDLYASGGFDEAAERRKLAAQLRAFGDTADYVPLVYATIHTEYGGDITRYVDDLFRRSAMTNRRRMMRVTRWPRKKRLQSDMGFQFALSKQLYRAWEQMDRPTQLIGHFVIPNQWKK